MSLQRTMRRAQERAVLGARKRRETSTLRVSRIDPDKGTITFAQQVLHERHDSPDGYYSDVCMWPVKHAMTQAQVTHVLSHAMCRALVQYDAQAWRERRQALKQAKAKRIEDFARAAGIELLPHQALMLAEVLEKA